MKVSGLYKIECYIFKGINRYFDQKTLNIFFSNITHIGGATFSIALTLFFLIFAKGTLHQAAIATAISLAISHIPVQILKRWYPRKRPYLTIQDAKYPVHPLKDHSFPSGHTTAVFSVFIPFICYNPSLLAFLLPLALCRYFTYLFRPSLSVRCIRRYVPWHLFWHHLFLSIHPTFHIKE